MPDLIALSRSLYALSQNKNDPNTNPEIMSCSRKDIFVDISWVTAKKDFFRPFILSKFCYKHSQNCSGVIRNDQNMTHQPSTALGGEEAARTPVARPAATSATTPGWHSPALPRLLLPWCVHCLLQGKEKTAVRILSKKQKDDFKTRFAVYIYYCDLKVNMLQRGF